MLYVGKAKNIKKRVTSYARPIGHDSRIARMIAATVTMEFVTTKTETEALLLEANLIKRLRPRFNVLLRDDKSFPYILITVRPLGAADPQASRRAHAARAIITGRSPIAGAVNRTINALAARVPAALLLGLVLRERARGRACCIRSSAARRPARGEIDFAGYSELVREANEFLSGRSQVGAEGTGRRRWTRPRPRSISSAPRSIATGSRRCRRSSRTRASIRAASRRPTCSPCIRPAATPASRCSSSAPGRTGATAPISRRPTARSAPAKCSSAFLAQFYDDKPPPRLILVSHEFEERALLAEALSDQERPQGRGRACRSAASARNWSQHALANAREALARKLADTSSQQKLLKALTETFALPRAPRRIEVYDNSHIAGTNAVGAMVVAGPEGFRKNQYRKFNIRSPDLTPGDDYGMMREVLQRRFKRLLAESAAAVSSTTRWPPMLTGEADDDDDEQPWPDLVLIDGGQGQLNAATRDAGRAGRHRRAAGRHRQGAGPRRRARDLLHGGPRARSSCRRAIRCSISSSGCATRPTASPSARTARAARRTSARPACRKFRGSGPPASARCCGISAL